MILFDVYFMLKGKGECVGAISLKEMHPTNPKITVWQTYKVVYCADNIILFTRNEHSFLVMNGEKCHEMGDIFIKIIKGNSGEKWLNVRVMEAEDDESWE